MEISSYLLNSTVPPGNQMTTYANVLDREGGSLFSI